MKKVLIVAPFCSLPNEPYFNRFLFLAQMLSVKYDVTLLTSSFRHFDKTHRDTSIVESKGFNIVLINEPGYKANVSFSRVVSHYFFCRNFKAWLKGNNSFDLVYSAYPLIQTNIIISQFKEKYGFKHVVDIQDVWPESMSSVFPLVSSLPLNFIPFSKKADHVYSSADALVAVSKTYLDRALRVANNTPSEVVYLGSNFEVIASVPRSLTSAGAFKVVYIGTLSHSYDVETVMVSIDELSREGVDVEFHVLGGGPFENKLRELKCNGVIFHGFLGFADAIAFVKSCDVAINPLVKSAAQSVTNKLSDYLAMGIPVINSQENSEVLGLLDMVCHENYKAGSVASFKQAFKKIYQRRGSLKFHPNNKFDRSIEYKKIDAIIEKVLVL
jgi:glycosyltransferase involved in cell wall biosynthesis